MITVFINNHGVTTKENQTILGVATATHIFIPTLCHLSGHPPRAVCRLCVVEVEGQTHLAPACATIVKEGMRINTASEKVVRTRQLVMEWILTEHGQCQRPDCEIERLAARLGVNSSRFVPFPEVNSPCLSSEYLLFQPQYCVHCDRCIRACQDKQVIHRARRGSQVTMTVGPSPNLAETPCVHCRDCAAVCPSGAIAAV